MPVTGMPRSEHGATARRPSASRPPLRRARPRARRRSGPSWVFRGLVFVGLLVLLVGVTAVGATGFVAVTSYTTLSRDLPDPKALATLSFEEPTIVYDRSGKVELGAVRAGEPAGGRLPRASRRSSSTRRRPRRTGRFWANDGYDLQAMIAAAIETLQGDGRGASTITQQLVRARLLPAEVVDPTADVYVRKAKEIIQSARLTAGLPGPDRASSRSSPPT